MIKKFKMDNVQKESDTNEERPRIAESACRSEILSTNLRRGKSILIYMPKEEREKIKENANCVELLHNVLSHCYPKQTAQRDDTSVSYESGDSGPVPDDTSTVETPEDEEEQPSSAAADNNEVNMDYKAAVGAAADNNAVNSANIDNKAAASAAVDTHPARIDYKAAVLDWLSRAQTFIRDNGRMWLATVDETVRIDRSSDDEDEGPLYRPLFLGPSIDETVTFALDRVLLLFCVIFRRYRE